MKIMDRRLHVASFLTVPLLIASIAGCKNQGRTCPSFSSEEWAFLHHYDVERRDECMAVTYHSTSSDMKNYYFYACPQSQDQPGFELMETTILKENLEKFRLSRGLDSSAQKSIIESLVIADISHLDTLLSQQGRMKAIMSFPEEGMMKINMEDQDSKSYFISYEDSSRLSVKTKALIAKYKIGEPIGNCVEVHVDW